MGKIILDILILNLVYDFIMQIYEHPDENKTFRFNFLKFLLANFFTQTYFFAQTGQSFIKCKFPLIDHHYQMFIQYLKIPMNENFHSLNQAILLENLN